jgi:S-formylglutathione hydrolase
MALTVVSTNKHFNGDVIKYEHESKEVGCKMRFNVFVPAQAAGSSKVPVLWFLSGMTLNLFDVFQA